MLRMRNLRIRMLRMRMFKMRILRMRMLKRMMLMRMLLKVMMRMMAMVRVRMRKLRMRTRMSILRMLEMRMIKARIKMLRTRMRMRLRMVRITMMLRNRLLIEWRQLDETELCWKTIKLGQKEFLNLTFNQTTTGEPKINYKVYLINLLNSVVSDQSKSLTDEFLLSRLKHVVNIYLFIHLYSEARARQTRHGEKEQLP